MDLEKFTDLFKNKDKIFIVVKESKNCLETRIESDINKLNPAYKKQLVAFLKEIIGGLEK